VVRACIILTSTDFPLCASIRLSHTGVPTMVSRMVALLIADSASGDLEIARIQLIASTAHRQQLLKLFHFGLRSVDP
jgi:hypothetical protein